MPLSEAARPSVSLGVALVRACLRVLVYVTVGVDLAVDRPAAQAARAAQGSPAR